MLQTIGVKASASFTFDQQLDSLIQELTEDLGFEFAAVSLIDEYQEVIETVRVRNVPAVWTSVVHALTSKDIHAEIVRTAVTEVISGWDTKGRFESNLFDRFDHAAYTRIFCPLWADERVIGVIEAGCKRAKETEVLTVSAIAQMEQIGVHRGKSIWASRPQALITTIATSTMEVIGADSASLHVFQQHVPNVHTLDNEYLVAWAGAADKTFVRRFPPRKSGLGDLAIATGRVHTIDNPSALAEANPALYADGIRAMVAVPLRVGNDFVGVLYLHFRSQEHRFSKTEEELLTVFAKQIEVTIHNSFLVKSIANLGTRGWTISAFQHIIHSLASVELDLPKALGDLAQHVLNILDASNVTLYQYFASSNIVQIPPVMRGKFLVPEAMDSELHPETTPRTMIAHGESKFIPNVVIEHDLSAPRPDGKVRFVYRENIRSCAALVLKVSGNNEIVGLMFVNYRSPVMFTSEEQRQIRSVASSLAIAIQTTRLREQLMHNLQRRQQELAAMRDVDLAIVSSVPTIGLQHLLELVLKHAMDTTEASSGAVYWLNQELQRLDLNAHIGYPLAGPPQHLQIGDGIIGLAARERVSQLVHNVASEKWRSVYNPLIEETQSELAIPVIDSTRQLRGVLNLESRVADAFTLDDQTFVEGLALQATIAAHGVELTQSLATRVRHLISLDYIAVRIQDGHDINSALRAIMTGITSAEGLAFSRCMFFSSEQNGRFLKGELAIGPQSDSEANEIWEALNRDRGKWGLAGRDVLDVLLERAANFGAAVSAGSEADSPLCRKVREVSVRNEGDRAGAIKTCLQERRAVLVPSGVNDPARFIIDATTNPTEPMCAFACVPLLGKDSEILGVLVADNRFLSREHIIEEYELIGLGAFARLMSMTIENWNLQRSLKNSNFVEFTTKMGHVVGSYIRQLVEEIKPLEHLVRTQNNDHPEWLRHIVGLTRNVEQIKSFLQDCKRVGPPKQGEYQTLDLVKILSETIDSIHLPFEIKLERAGIQHPVFVRGVGRELSYAFTELLTNAALALGDQTAPEIKILVEVEPRAGGVGMSVRVEIEDNGVGIRAVPISRVFDLFFTEGTQGSGLGLAIVKQTITEHHGGTIAVVQGQPLGSRFIIRLPALAHESLGGL